jgi:3-oxoacyl-[acyl-carrier-protein] synthase II
MDSRDSVILGYDMVSPLGSELDLQWDRASRGESGVKPLTRFPMNDNFPVRIAGQVDDIDVGPYPFLKPREMAHWTSPIYKHALLVVHRALTRSGVEITKDIAPRTAITFSTAVGGLDAVLKADRLMISDNKLPHPFTNPNSCINMVGGKVSILTGATGPITATITACATGCTSMIIGAMFIRMGLADVAICGAVDFCLVEPILAGFATMNGAMKNKAGEPLDPEKACRPFSPDRKGFIVSEGAGSIIIAAREFARAHGLSHEIELAGWSMTSDANHFVAPNYETVKRCVVESIERAGLAPGDIAAVNAHATSTKVGDKIESDVMKDIFADRVPPVTANKSFMGHAMGASSAIESIFSMEGMRRGALLPTINYTPDPEIDLPVATGLMPLEQELLLKNSFGFGGCNSCIVFKRVS